MGTLLHSSVVFVIVFVLPTYPAHYQISPCLRTRFRHISPITYLTTYYHRHHLFTCYSKFQNTIGVNLLGTLLHSSVVLVTPCLTYIPSLLPDLTVFTHKVPSYIYYQGYGMIKSDAMPLKVLVATTLKATTL